MAPATWLPPPPDLRPWCDGGVALNAPATLAHSQFPALTGAMLVVRLAGDVGSPAGGRLPAAALIGPSTRPTCFSQAGAVHAVGLLVRPAALAALLRGSPSGVVDGHVALADLQAASRPWADAADLLAALPGDGPRLAWLFNRLRDALAGANLQPAQRLALALQRPPAEARAGLGLSARSLHRHSLAHFGLAPKPFHVISRLQQALHAAPRLQGAPLALQSGYDDQSHLGRDLRRLAGQPLTRLLQSARQDGSSHWPLAVGWQLSD